MAYYLDLMDNKHIELAQKFRVNQDSCSNPLHYEHYLKFCALSDKKAGKGVTHIFIDRDDSTSEERIMGFITLKSSSITMFYEDTNKLVGRPALEISELAVDADYERRGIGTLLVKYAVGVAVNLNDSFLGIEYVTLCADPSVVDFYLRDELEFKKLEDFYELPREYWNLNCIPLALKLHF